MATKDFHLGDILSVTTGHLVSPRHMEGVYDILNWMTGEILYTHQLPRVAREAGPVLLVAHPKLASISVPEFAKPDEVLEWLADQVAIYGEALPVPQLTEDQHESIDPISELAEKVHPDKIVVVPEKAKWADACARCGDFRYLEVDRTTGRYLFSAPSRCFDKAECERLSMKGRFSYEPDDRPASPAPGKEGRE